MLMGKIQPKRLVRSFFKIFVIVIFLRDRNSICSYITVTGCPINSFKIISFHKVRACRNAIEFNQIPSIGDIIPGGRDAMKLDVLVAVPPKYQTDLNLSVVKAAFPYGQIRVQVQDGGMIANSGKAIESMGDKNTDMIVVCVAVTVGY